MLGIQNCGDFFLKVTGFKQNFNARFKKNWPIFYSTTEVMLALSTIITKHHDGLCVSRNNDQVGK